MQSSVLHCLCVCPLLLLLPPLTEAVCHSAMHSSHRLLRLVSSMPTRKVFVAINPIGQLLLLLCLASCWPAADHAARRQHRPPGFQPLPQAAEQVRACCNSFSRAI
jgi:hypothetical protein